ncbi:MAG: ParB/RepB/Spo0J family partition protein [Proteobacteria bacterium]|nr:ParB/RepB/Spo0J family partition protein [Pseudomonadota bacterium]
MQKKPNGLGRGLGALLNADASKPNTNTPIAAINNVLSNQNNANVAKAEDNIQGSKPNTDVSPKSPALAAKPTGETPNAIANPLAGMNTLKTSDLPDLQKRTQASQSAGQQVLELSPLQLTPLVDQPRTEFYSSTLDELAVSIKSYGILQPIVIAPTTEPDKFTIIAGERRWRAAQIAGLSKVPCVIRQPSEHSSLELALIENIQREELSPLDEARAFSRLIDEHSYTQDTLANKVGKDRATVANSLRLLSLPAEILTDLQAKALTAGHARALCSLDEKKMQLKVRDMIISKKLSVRQTEDIVKELKKDRDANEPSGSPQLSPDLRHLCDQFKGHLGTKVRITGTADRGRIEISYYTFEDLERIAELMLSPALNPRRLMT